MEAGGGGAKERRPLDPFVWKACAGSSAHIPAVDSLVYYLPQGHAEQASVVPDLSPSVSGVKACFLCRLTAVRLLANQDTDEVYAWMDLDPRVASPDSSFSPEDAGEEGGGGGGGGVVFAKVLTSSDANNGGGFSVPRFCADSVFPPLDYNADPPVQVLAVTDVHGAVWEFRHIYRGTPRRHLLTSGWSKFVNCKKLVAGDSIVFIKKVSGELFVGVRRAVRSAGPSDLLQYSPRSIAKLGENLGAGKGLSGNYKGKVSPESVMEAVRLAGTGRPFEVVYYPREGLPGFVVRKDVVESAVRARWSTGTRVKIETETEDSSRMTSFQGTVSSIVPHPAPFTYCPWRTLEASWDEPNVLQDLQRVSPWQLELVSASPQILNLCPTIKKPRTTQNHELLTDCAEKNVFFRSSGFSNEMMGSINPHVFSHTTFPVGIQGARHDPICISSLSNLFPNGTHQMFSGKLNSNDIPQKASRVSSELNIGIASQLENSLLPNQNSIYYSGSDLFSNLGGKTSAKVVKCSLKLFGKTIQIEQPVVADVNAGCKDNKDTPMPFNISFPYPVNQFHDGHDDQLHGVSAVKT